MLNKELLTLFFIVINIILACFAWICDLLSSY